MIKKVLFVIALLTAMSSPGYLDRQNHGEKQETRETRVQHRPPSNLQPEPYPAPIIERTPYPGPVAYPTYDPGKSTPEATPTSAPEYIPEYTPGCPNPIGCGPILP